MARRSNNALRRALLETELQLGPQGAALRGLRSERAGEYTRTRRVNASNERAIVGAIDQALPKAGRSWDEALATVTAQQRALGGVPGEQASAFSRRVGEQKAGDLTDLTDRRTRATEGRVYANEEARSSYLSDKAKINSQLQDLMKQSGLLTATRYGDLLDEAAERGIERGKARETERANRAGERLGREKLDLERSKEQRIATEGPKKKGVKWATQEQHAAAKDAIEYAKTVIAQQKQIGRGRAETIQLLVKGRPQSKVTNKDGEEVTIPPIQAIGGDYARAATNLVFDGTLSRGDVKRLHGRRLQIKRLGYQTRKPKRPRSLVDQILSGIPGRG